MTATAMVSLRIDPELLAALKEQAKREGRSVSAEVVRIIRKEVEAERPPRPPTSRRTMGMFSDFEAPELDDFRRFRRETSRGVRRRVGRATSTA